MFRRRRRWFRVDRYLLLLAFTLCFLTSLYILNYIFGKTDVEHPQEENNVEINNPIIAGDSVIKNSTLHNLSVHSNGEKNSVNNKKVAYVVIISNEKYVDGALVVGFSLAQQSTLVSNGEADLILMFPEKRISLESQTRLKCAGWTHVMEVYDLSVHAPRARLKDTFNKLHIFNLTMYSRVAIFDGDMLIIRNPDIVFDADLPNENYIGAIGSHSRQYFQTGMMLIIPSLDVLYTLLDKLQNDPLQRDHNGRDGRLIRSYFKDRYITLRHALSIHIRPGDPLIHRAIGLHYRGSWKPWFNREDPPPPPKRITPDTPGQELGKPYRLWWSVYEELHVKCMAGRDAFRAPTRDAAAPVDYNASESMWLMRHTPYSYIQPMEWLDVRRRNLTHPHLRIVESEEGASCDEACHNTRVDDNENNNETLRCVEKALSFVSVNSEETLHRIFHCKHSTLDYPAPYHPSFNVRTSSCYINSLHGKRERPTCGAKAPLHRRICTCMKSSEYSDNISFIPFGSHLTSQAITDSALPSNHTTRNESDGNNGAEACAIWFPQRIINEKEMRRSQTCAAFLSNWERMEVIPRQNDARTIKLLFHYKTGVRAIVKLEQLSFPLEPHAEYAAYATSLILGIGMVPPTTLVYVPSQLLRQTLLQYIDTNNTNNNNNNSNNNNNNTTEKEFLQRELWWMRTVNSKDSALVCVSVQLWTPYSVMGFANITPPITQSRFEQWLQEEDVNKRRDVVHGGELLLMQDISTMIFFDYIIGNEDRSFSHNAFVTEKGNSIQLIMLDHGKSFHIENEEIPGNMLSLQKSTTAMENNPIEIPMCKIPEIILRQALRLSHKRYEPLNSLLPLNTVNESNNNNNNNTQRDNESLDWMLLHTMAPINIPWLLSEKSITATQLRLEKALQHFARCVDIFGFQYVIGD